MNSVQDGKVVDCVLFKQELHERAYKKSGARNFNEYIDFANAASLASSRHTQPGAQRRLFLVEANSTPKKTPISDTSLFQG